MANTTDPALVQLGKILREQLSNEIMSEAAMLLLKLVDEAFNNGFTSGVTTERRAQNLELGANHPTILLVESIHLLIEIGECDSVLEALELIAEKPEPSLNGPIEVLKMAIEVLREPISDGED